MLRAVKWGGVIAAAVALAAVAAMTWGCASTAPGADPLLVRCEQSLAVSFELADAFLRIEAAQPEALAAVAPWAPSIAQRLRTDGPAIFTTAERAVDLYRKVRSPAAREEMLLALAEPEALAEQARLAVSQWALRGSKKGGTP